MNWNVVYTGCPLLRCYPRICVERPRE